jgi:hypothetical protein
MGLADDVKEIKEILEPTKNLKTKRFRLPFRAKVGKSKAKQNWVGIIKINENGSITPMKQQIVEQTIIVDGVPRLATPDYVMRWKLGFRTYPIVILPSWSVEPFSPKQNFQTSLENGSNIAGYKLLMNRMKLANIEKPKVMGGMLKWIIGLGLAGIIIYAFMTGGA